MQWPALEVDPTREPSIESGRIRYAQGVWGKAHGAASDFRWIARSSRFDVSHKPEIEISTGLEDQASEGGLWRSAGRYCYAVHCYRSRAKDRAGRTSFLEKQALQWMPQKGAPHALGALVLLNSAADLDDSTWWEHRRSDRWQDPSYFLSVPTPAAQAWEAAGLQRLLDRALQALKEHCPAEELSRFFASWAARERPAFLQGLEGPLPARALAALLLPLPRQWADRTSLAGWLFSSRIDADAAGRRWDGAACSRPPQGLQREAPAKLDERHLEFGDRCAQALLEGRPELARQTARRFSARNSASSPGPVPSAAAEAALRRAAARLRQSEAGWSELQSDLSHLPPALKRFLRFALDPARWWLEPDELDGMGSQCLDLFPGDSPQSELMASCIERLESEASKALSAQGWKVKADLARALWLVLSPYRSPYGQRRWPESELVPPLLFAALIKRRHWPRLAESTGAEGLRRSRLCPYRELVSRIEPFVSGMQAPAAEGP